MDSPNTLVLDHYFPSDVLKITEVIETDKVIIYMKSLSRTCVCPRCHQTLWSVIIKVQSQIARK